MAHGRDHAAEPQQGGSPRQGHLSLREICADFARREARLSRRAARLGLSRREFIEVLAVGAAATTAGAALPSPVRAAENLPRSRVVVVRHPEVLIKGYRVNPIIVRQMLDRAVMELTGKRDGAEAWACVAKEGDFVAVKHNSMGHPTLHSHTEIDDAVAVQLAAEAQVRPDCILVVDRQLPAPYNELSEPFTLPSRGLKTHLRRLYTDKATAIVNVSVLKAHFGDGISAAMKNHLGSVNNPAAFHGWRPDRLPKSLPELNALPPLREKTRLVVVDAVRPLFAAGPADNLNYRWDHRAMIVTTDPVAATAVGLRILEKKRAEVRGRPWPMTAARQMVAHGQQIGLGNADPDRIDLVEVDLG